MLSEVSVRESSLTVLELELAQAELLHNLGRKLSSNRAWWGDDGVEVARSVVDVQRRGASRWGVTFREVVGVVRLGDLQIRVIPKIPQNHFNYLVQHSDLAPRHVKLGAQVDQGEEFVGLVARWCVSAAERVLKAGLRVDYRVEQDELQQVRGRLDPFGTALAVGRGRPVAVCEFEELDEDMPLNRVVKGACHVIAAFQGFAPELRSRARAIIGRMAHVGSLRHEDRSVKLDRLTRRYNEVLPLALLILSGGGVQTRVGACVGTVFLMRTPELIEDGFRTLLATLLPDASVTKKKLALGDSGLTLNPDLVFLGGKAVGDVKYRFLSNDWDRPSLNQAVTFATGFGSRRCGIVGFRARSGQPLPPPVPVGHVEARAFGWDASHDAIPAESAARIASEISLWLQQIG